MFKVKLLSTPISKPINDPLYYCPNISLAMLSSFLHRHGINVEKDDLNTKVGYYKKKRKINVDVLFNRNFFENFILDKNVGLYPEIQIRRILGLTKISYNHRLIGFSVQTESQLISSLILAKFIKKKYKSKIVLGGPYITAMCADKNVKKRNDELFRFFQKFSFIDWIVVGQGEIPLLRLIQYLKNEKKIEEVPNLIYIKGGKLKINSYFDGPPIDYEIHDFDGLPINEYIQLSKHIGIFSLNLFYYPITRGCLYKCTFCGARCTDPKPHCRNPEVIIHDLKLLCQKYKINEFLFGADMININESHLYEICEKIISENLKIKWIGIVAPKRFSYKLLKKMKEAGCVKLSFGSETGSQKILNDMNKPYAVEEVEKAIKMCHKVGIETNLYFIVGFPTETDEDFKSSLNFLVKNKKYITTLVLNIFHLDRNSPIYINPEKFGIFNIRPDSFWDIPFGYDCKFDKKDKMFEQIVINMKNRMEVLEKVLIANKITYLLNITYGYKILAKSFPPYSFNLGIND
jgi:hypothetical protein